MSDPEDEAQRTKASGGDGCVIVFLVVVFGIPLLIFLLTGVNIVPAVGR